MIFASNNSRVWIDNRDLFVGDLEILNWVKESMSSGDEEDVQRRNSGNESDDADSGAGSDDFDLLELGETGAEFCQIGNQTCSIPLELYDLSGLEDILSVDVWNDCLSEDKRFELAKYLADMDQELFTGCNFQFRRPVKKLFDMLKGGLCEPRVALYREGLSFVQKRGLCEPRVALYREGLNFVQKRQHYHTGCNFQFGSPVKKLFDMLKDGLCEPRVSLYKEGLDFVQKRQHYHLLKKHQNNMVSNLCQIRDAWLNCRGYSIEECHCLGLITIFYRNTLLEQITRLPRAPRAPFQTTPSTTQVPEEDEEGVDIRPKHQPWSGDDYDSDPDEDEKANIRSSNLTLLI